MHLTFNTVYNFDYKCSAHSCLCLKYAFLPTFCTLIFKNLVFLNLLGKGGGRDKDNALII